MFQFYAFGVVFLLIFTESLSVSIQPKIFEKNIEEKQLLKQQEYEFAIESIQTQLELIKTEFKIIHLRIELLEAKFDLTKIKMFSNFTEFTEKVRNKKSDYLLSEITAIIKYQFELMRETQKNLKTDLNELKSSIKSLSISNEIISKNITKFCSKNYNSNEALEVKNVQNFSKSAYLPSNCMQATALNNFKDDIYLLDLPSNNLQPFFAYCYHQSKNSKAWTIIQRREDGSENFNRNWLDYKRGFGDVYGEYWLGLERIYEMTKNQPHELWISLRAFNSSNRYAEYSNFSIDNESEGYQLTIGDYKGNAGDAFNKHNGMKFSTFDRNNSPGYKNCAQAFKGGWWYRDCFFCNLNGVYRTYSNKETDGGINWYDWLGYQMSLKYSHMAIRPIS